MNTYDRALHWMRLWHRAEGHYGRCCAAALHEGHVDTAYAFAARAHRCHLRHLAACIRTARKSSPAKLSDIDWYGDGDS